MRGERKLGDVIHVRYKDHVLFKDSDASQFRPWTRECIGWLDYEDKNYIRIVWERFPDLNPAENGKIRSTGLAIIKKDIVEICRLA